MSPVDEETIQTRRNRLSSVPRACEGCKIRKIRCDRTIPCANCQASKIACRNPNDKTRGQLQADKVTNLEGTVDRLEKHICGIESRLAALEHSQPITVAGDAINLDVSCSETRAIDQSRLVEVGPSFTSQSLQATEGARIAARSASTFDGSAIDHSLHQLQETLRASQGLSKDNFFFRKSISQFPPTPQPLPATLVTCVLQAVRVRRPIFLSSYAISDLELIESLCQRVYSTSNLASAGEIACMHGVLFFILKELIAIKDPLCQKFDLAFHLDHCEQNFITAIETYEVLAVPSFENILALTMGMLKSQGEGKPYLYRKLVSAAFAHCETLGYHRESTYRSRSIALIKSENMRRLFWTVYTFDKNMSLVLGRVSNMQGLEIDTKHPTVSGDVALRAWDESFIMGIRLAELQGRIFVGLYSTTTMTNDSSERARLIDDLAASMEKWHSEFQLIDSTGVNSPQVFSLSRGNWDILFFSTLTLLFHASSSSGAQLQISPRCLNAARSSLQAHLDFFPRYQESQLLSDGDYFNWILLSSSFVPFIVTFLHAVATKDMPSIILLEQVVGTLENFRNISQGSENLYQICAAFTQVARKLVQSQSLPEGTPNSQLDALQFSGSHNTTLFDPEILQDGFESGEIDGIHPSYAMDILSDWLSGPPFPWDKFDVDLESLG